MEHKFTPIDTGRNNHYEIPYNILRVFNRHRFSRNTLGGCLGYWQYQTSKGNFYPKTIGNNGFITKWI